MPDEKSKSLYQIGRDYFHIEIWFYNFLEKYEPYEMPFSLVEDLVIEEMLMDWNVKGYITIKNPFEILERGALPGTKTRGIEPKIVFRTDGRNRLSIKIKPLQTKKDGLIEDFPLSDEWEINHDFIVYDIEDHSSTDNDPSKKTKTLFFKDEKFQILNERNIEWSTSMNADPTSLDKDRTMTGSEAIKDILNVASKITGGDKTTLLIGYDEQGSINKPNIPLNKIDDKNWDLGPEDNSSRILYTSPAYSSVYMDINYILSNTKSSDNMPVILDYGRHTKDKSWKLYSLSKLFSNTKENQIEHLFIVDGMPSNEITPHIPRGYEGEEDYASSFASFIMNYQISPMVAVNDNKFVNTPVYNYDFSTGEYKIIFSGNTVKDVIKKAKELGKNLYNFKVQKVEEISISTNPTKMLGMATRALFIPQSFYLSDCAGLTMLKDLIFLNDTISFKVNGLTKRTPGKFIYIDREATSKNPYDDRFLGQWFIIKILHHFTPSSYKNDVIASKIDNASKIWPEEDKSY